jgi:phosphatidylglycerophosphate synthase
MFDRIALEVTKPLVDATARQIVKRGISADQVTLACFVLGMTSALFVMLGHFQLALIPLLLGRICDGLDGAVARLTVQSDRGAFMDIALDFLFYASIPLAFAVAAPEVNALPGAVLLAAFVGTGTSFLAYATLAEKRGEKSTAYPSKSFYYLGGLTEGTETIAIFVLMCLFPRHFPLLAYIYASLCTLTTATRIIAGWQNFAATKK